jgi:hypothetical protein
VTRRLSDEALLSRLNVRHVAYLRQILGGERPLSEAVRAALLAEVAK